MTAEDDFLSKAVERELERLKRFSARLSELPSDTTAFGPDLDAAQDANLDAFESMTETVGVAALERMTLLTDQLTADLESDDDPAATAQIAPRLRAAAEELDALRDRETERLLDQINGLMAQGAGRSSTDPTQAENDEDAK